MMPDDTLKTNVENKEVYIECKQIFEYVGLLIKIDENEYTTTFSDKANKWSAIDKLERC